MDYEFLADNYVWIIVIAVIIIMTIIGYIADKTKFGEKKEKNEKIKPVKKMEKDEEIIVSEPHMDDFMTEESSMDNFMMEQPVEQEVTLNNTNTDFEMPNEDMGFESFEPVAPLEEETKEEAMDFEMPMEAEPVQNEENLSESIVETVSETAGISAEENINQESLFSEETVEDFGLPNIDTLNQEIAEVEEDEDVWKF